MSAVKVILPRTDALRQLVSKLSQFSVMTENEHSRMGESKLKQLRERASLTQEELSRRCKIPLRTYQRWELGDSVARPTVPQVKALCRELKIAVEQLPDDFGPISYQRNSASRERINIPASANIPEEKLTRYLLVWREQKDKSKFLAQAGFTQEDPEALRIAIFQLTESTEALEDGSNEYGIFYRIEGHLQGVNGRDLAVIVIWIRWYVDQTFHFVTLKPQKEPQHES